MTGFSCGLIGSLLLLPAALAAPVASGDALFKIDQMPTKDRFVEEARPCALSAMPAPGTPSGGATWLPLGCLTASAPKNTVSVLMPEASGFSVKGPEAFTLHSLRPLFFHRYPMQTASGGSGAASASDMPRPAGI